MSFSYYRELRGRARTREHVGRSHELLSASAGWILPQRRICWASERHNVLRRDEGGRLHCDDGPAIAFPDRWMLYFWHGVRVPAEWIEQRDTLEAAIALTWPNIEQRRAAAEIIGWSKVLSLVPTRVVHADPDPQIGTLLECDLPDVGPSRFLRVRCGTGREFALCIPREITTARQANAWTYGLESDEYQLEARS